MTTILTERNRLPDIVRQELDGFSRETVTFTASAISLCAVVGCVTKGAPVAAADAGNAGNGVISGLALGDQAESGVYSLECTVAGGSNAGTFAVFTPEGLRLKDAVVGKAYISPHLALTIGDGTADFAVGDGFEVTVPDGSGKYKILAPTAVDGTQVAAGIAIADYDAATVDVRGVIINRHAKAIGALLSWPTGITAVQKTKALAQLAALGIQNTTGV